MLSKLGPINFDVFFEIPIVNTEEKQNIHSIYFKFGPRNWNILSHKTYLSQEILWFLTTNKLQIWKTLG